jgi:outer membrane protein OmpA-like peptidoglycan-associated protein
VTLGAGGAPAGARSIVFAGGVLHLGGRVPDRETAEELEANVAVAAFGRAMISAEYIVDEDASEAATEVLTTEGTTLFLPESEDITPAASALLDFGAALLREHPRMRWTVEVHTDNLGSDEYNLTLSQRRADAIVAGLVARGADPAQLLAVGKGEGEPIADNATRAGREANRRVEIDIDGLLD